MIKLIKRKRNPSIDSVTDNDARSFKEVVDLANDKNITIEKFYKIIQKFGDREYPRHVSLKEFNDDIFSAKVNKKMQEFIEELRKSLIKTANKYAIDHEDGFLKSLG